jgi:hypothetical protein
MLPASFQPCAALQGQVRAECDHVQGCNKTYPNDLMTEFKYLRIHSMHLTQEELTLM